MENQTLTKEEEEEKNVEHPPKINVSFVLMILNCEKYMMKAQHQKETWLHPSCCPSMVYYHVRANPTLDQEFYFDDENHVLTVRGQDDYLSLPSKVMKAQQAILSRFTFDYLFKTDDDQHLVVPNFFQLLYIQLMRKLILYHYGGQSICIPETSFSKYYLQHPELPTNILVEKGVVYCTGRFYFLSHQAVSYLVQHKFHHISSHYLEDYAVGYHLDRKFKEHILHINTPAFFIG